jgi:hypothetical protein
MIYTVNQGSGRHRKCLKSFNLRHLDFSRFRRGGGKETIIEPLGRGYSVDKPLFSE